LGHTFIFDLIAVRSGNSGLLAVGFYCVIVGCIGAVAAALPGAWDWIMTVPPNSSAKSRALLHDSLNVVDLLLFIYVAYRLDSPTNPPDTPTLLGLPARPPSSLKRQPEKKHITPVNSVNDSFS
jgi:hypothetical protein